MVHVSINPKCDQKIKLGTKVDSPGNIIVANKNINNIFLPLKLNLANPYATSAEIPTSPNNLKKATNAVFKKYLKNGTFSNTSG